MATLSSESRQLTLGQIRKHYFYVPFLQTRANQQEGTMKSRSAFVLLTVLLIFGVAGLGKAQVTTATLYGIIQDQSGAAIAGAQITLTHDATAAARQTTSDGSGEFVFTALPVGGYTLKIEKSGFKAYVRTGIELAASQNVRQTHALEVGELTQAVTVQSSASLINNVSAEQRESMGTLQVRELPLSLVTCQSGS